MSDVTFKLSAGVLQKILTIISIRGLLSYKVALGNPGSEKKCVTNIKKFGIFCAEPLYAKIIAWPHDGRKVNRVSLEGWVATESQDIEIETDKYFANKQLESAPFICCLSFSPDNGPFLCKFRSEKLGIKAIFWYFLFYLRHFKLFMVVIFIVILILYFTVNIKIPKLIVIY